MRQTVIKHKRNMKERQNNYPAINQWVRLLQVFFFFDRMNTCIRENVNRTGGRTLDHKDDCRSIDSGKKLKVSFIYYILIWSNRKHMDKLPCHFPNTIFGPIYVLEIINYKCSYMRLDTPFRN